jgi:hypothetical protein
MSITSRRYAVRTRLIITVLPIAMLSACASILDGSNQSISVKTISGANDIVGARCTVINDKGTWYVTSPGSVTVQRSYDTLNVKCESDGYIANAGSAPSSTKGLAFGNILFGGLIGAAVDVGTGAAYDYPSPIIVNLQPVKATVLGTFNGS